MKIRIIF